MEKHFLSDPEKILIRKQGQEILLLTHYSGERNVATRFIEGNENSYFLPADAPLEEIFQGRLFAECWDNAAPLWTGKHQHIGGNHGSCFAFRVHLLRHWLFESDLGKVLVDDAGERFVLTSIESLSDFTIHSDIPASYGEFCEKVTGNLHLEGKTIVPETLSRTALSPAPGTQLSPHKRYRSTRLLIDGKREIAEGETVECSFAELHWEIDLILPEALLAYLKNHPGKYVSPVDPRLEAAIRSRMVTTFHPRCARTAECEVTFLRDFPEPVQYGMLQFYGGIGFTDHERLLPGVRKVTEEGLEIDLAGTCRFPAEFPVARFYTKADCPDPAKLPCRCIDFFGNGGKRELGVALGYSLSRGITARGREAERGNTLFYLYRTKKIYPFAFECREAKRGESFHLCAYQHYFLPDASGVSCFHHPEPDGYFLYADFPAPAEDFTVSLPSFLAGKKTAVAESDPGLSAAPCVTPDARLSLRAEKKGGIVLKIG